MNVRLHIDRLVLDGIDLPHAARGALRAAVEQELARLVAGGGLAHDLGRGVAVPAVRAPQIDATGTPAQLGAAIAGALYGGVGGKR